MNRRAMTKPFLLLAALALPLAACGGQGPVERPPLEGTAIGDHESPAADEQWNRMVDLRLIPHPNIAHKGAVEADYGMRYGTLPVRCRAAVAGYALRRWGVDCSRNLDLSAGEFQLALANRDVLRSISSAALAPGWRSHES